MTRRSSISWASLYPITWFTFTNPETWCKPKWTDIRALPCDLRKSYLLFGMHFRAGSIDIPACCRKDEDERKRNAIGNNVAHLF